MRATGEMPEWPNGTDSKSVVLVTVPRVQIPISPPYIEKPLNRKIQGLFVFRSDLRPGEHRGIGTLEFDPPAPGNSGAFEQHIGNGCECDTDRNDQDSRQQV